MRFIYLPVAVLSAISLLSACAPESSDLAAPENITLTDGWVLEGFDAPESVIPSAKGDSFYVSNVKGEGRDKDGNGYISRISLDGKMLDKTWASGLDAPKGMALSGNVLFVSDIDHLVQINAMTGEVISRTLAEGGGFLNDVAVSETGVLVSDSANARIYRFADGEMSVWKEDARFQGINGLHVQEDRLLITTMGEGHLLSMDWDSQEIEILATGMKNADGIGVLPDGRFVISAWPGELFEVGGDGTTRVIQDTTEAPIFMNDIYLMDDALITPNWQPGTVRTYQVN